MKILKEDSLYCSDCYFLISARSLSRTSVSLLVHYLDTPIPVRADKIVHEVIGVNETIQYVYYTSKHFNLSVDTNYGSLTVTVATHSKNIVSANVTHRGLINVTHETETQHNNVYDNGTAYIITVKAASFCSYTLQVISEKDVVQMKYGVPSHLLLTPNHQ